MRFTGNLIPNRVASMASAIGAVLILLSCADAVAGGLNIEIGPDTTVVDGPLNADGTVNYIAALNVRFGQNVTASTNMAAGLIRAIGPGLLPDETRNEVLARLGLDDLIAQGRADHVAWNDPPPLPPDEDESPDYRWYDMQLAAQTGPWAEHEYPAVAAWLDSNRTALEAIRVATQRSRYFMPLVTSSLPKRGLPPLGIYQEVCRALIADAMRKAHAGDMAGACENILAVHRFAALVSRGPTLNEYLLALAIDRLASHAGIVLLEAGLFSPAQAKAQFAAVSALPALSSPADVLDCGARFHELAVVMMIAVGDPLDDVFGCERLLDMRDAVAALDVDWNEVLRLFNHWYDRLVAAQRLPSIARRRAATRALGEDLDALIAYVAAQELDQLVRQLDEGRGPSTPAERAEASRIVGRYILNLRTAPLTQLIRIAEHAMQHRDLVEVALAIEVGRNDHGRYPSRLQSLTPRYMPTLPEDRFSGADLLYRRMGDGYILYSVGPNGLNDGGAGDDIVVRIQR